MKKMIFFVIIFLAFVLIILLAARADASAKKPIINAERMLKAIAEVEDWKGRQGKFGEKGPYQITKSVWRSYTMMDFTDENVQKHGKEIALCHLDWIMHHLEIEQFPMTSFNVALIWGAGWGAFSKAIYSDAKADYAKRVQNIYLTWQK
jgi:hypothetical protein